MSVPFEERGGPIRGCLDLLSGRYPRFVFGGPIGADLLPVFHFHDVTAADLDAKLCYLANNGYRTVQADEVAAFARRERRIDERHVALCFDDAWASLWTVAAPLLKAYELTAITYAIPARIEEADACRPQEGDPDRLRVLGASANLAAQMSTSPFVTWPELRALHAAGIVDVQCHTDTHSMIPCSAVIADFVTPEFEAVPLLNRPQLTPPPSLRFVRSEELGAPLYRSRSRMSGARRVAPSLRAHERCVHHVADHGGADFFSRLDWDAELGRVAADSQAAEGTESDSERRQAIETELVRGRSVLNDRLGTNAVNHVCLPWGVSSDDTAAEIARLGFRSAIANRMPGMLAVRAGDDPFWLKRLPNKYIFHLPGRGRRLWV
jgi:hypothetical protein